MQFSVLRFSKTNFSISVFLVGYPGEQIAAAKKLDNNEGSIGILDKVEMIHAERLKVNECLTIVSP